MLWPLCEPCVDAVPFAKVAVLTSGAFLLTGIPLLIADGLRGLAIGSVVCALSTLVGSVRSMLRGSESPTFIH